ncbi:MAG: CvpA family protein [bacterium]
MFDTLGFTLADGLALVAVLIGIGAGFRQGLSGQMTFLLTVLALWFCLTHGVDPCHHWLIQRFGLSQDKATVAAKALLIILPVLAGMLLYLLLRYLFKITFTNWVDRIGGALAGGVTALGLVVLVFMLLATLPPERRPDAVGNKSWITREIIGTETQLVHTIMSRVEKGETLIEKARAAKAGKREKWED